MSASTLDTTIVPMVLAVFLIIGCASPGPLDGIAGQDQRAPLASSQQTLEIIDVRLERPTLTNLGVQVLIGGDTNRDATVEVRFREVGTSSWNDAQPLFRVRSAVVVGWPVPPQFAGSIFDLRPATSYEIELQPADPDGPAMERILLSATTRPVPPPNPASPRVRPVRDSGSLRAALATARPGDVILLGEGTYEGTFKIYVSGTQRNPIVIRGEQRDTVVLDGQGCTRQCDVIEIHGSYVHLERLTLQNADHAIDFPITGITGNVVRRVHTRNTRMGILARQGQFDSYICDNVLQGRLPWPHVYTDDRGARANDNGILVDGEGHVVCHNELSGFSDALAVRNPGGRAIDFYGNDVLWSYDNGLEFDGSVGNTRGMRNRFTNTFMPLSFQPVYGGPSYAFRNVAVNNADEQFKFHGLATRPPRAPSGMILWHNSFVSPSHAVLLKTTATSYNFTLLNNIFVGPDRPSQGRTVSWDGPINSSRIDYNGYYPDGDFAWQFTRGRVFYSSFADMQSSGMEQNGVLLDKGTFADGLVAPRDYRTRMEPQDASLAPGARAIDRGLALANVNDDFTGRAPDLGALELGCPRPIYGVRPEGIDESNQRHGCAPDARPGGGR